MIRVVSLSRAVLLLLLTLSATAFAHPGAPSRSPVEWMKGYTLVLVDASSKSDLADARDFIVAQGGTVAIVLPPHTILGWISPEVGAKILGKHGIRSIHRSAIDAQSTGFSDRETQIAIKLFNDIASGVTARRKLREAKQATGPEADRPGMVDCALPRPPIDRNDLIRNLRLLGAESSARNITPQFFGNSDVMDGTIAVAVFLVESNGGIDPDTYTWSATDQTFAISQVIDGLNWWVDQSRAFTLGRPLQFTVIPYLATNPACHVPYEPVLHEGRDTPLWINRIMSNLGAIEGDSTVRVAAFDQRLKDENRANWAYSIFLAYNPAPARQSYADGRASWAYLGGPYATILFRSFGWQLSRIISHETGHIFYACDEYSQPGYATCSCTCAPEVRPE
ncbi:MAG TPA: hypothetical protein VF747_09420, partial [Blastocatellia bacterium]